MLFYEAGYAPTTRSVRELASLRRHGWKVTVAHQPSAAPAVQALGFGSLPLPEPPGNPISQRVTALLARLGERYDALRVTAQDLTDQVRSGPGDGATLRARLDVLNHTVAELVVRIQSLRAAKDRDGETVARTELETAKRDRASVAEQLGTVGASERARLESVKAELHDVSAQIRGLRAARRTTSPLTGGTTFGDLARLEPTWHEHAQAMAPAQADVLWAADLDGLPPVIWASEAEDPPRAVIFDSHELFPELPNLPELYRVGWRLLAQRFVPRATMVVATSAPHARILEQEYGARRTRVIANLAVAGAPPAVGLRERLGLSPGIAVAVHIGNVGPTRNPHLAVDLAADLPGLHVAFVGSGSAAIVDELRARASARAAADRVHFVAPVPIDELTGFLADADVSLIMFDGRSCRHTRYVMPNKLYDSLASGVPVVAAANLFAGEFLVEEGLGGVFDLDTPGSLVAAVRDLLADPAIRVRVRQRAATFTWPTAEPQLFELVNEVLSATAPVGSPASAGDG